MNDHIAGEDLAAYVDGVLTAGKTAELESHFSRCPDCLAALADTIAMQGSRATIPGEFLRRALGRGQNVRKASLHLRLAFEIAAVFLVVVVIGYYFLAGNRFWQAGSGPNEQIEKSLPAALPEQVGPGGKGIAEKDLAPGDAMGPPAQTKPLEKKTGPAAAGKERRSPARDKKEIALMKLEPAPAAARTMREDAAKMNDAEAVQSRAAGTVAAEALQPALAAKAQAAPAAAKAKEGGEPLPRLLIAGDVGRGDLLEPGLLDGWVWFRKGLILELLIDPGGTVSAVIPVGPWERATANRAEKAARQLVFAVSARKSRRARISLSALEPN